MTTRILVCTQQFWPKGGISAVVKALNRAWVDFGCTVHVMAPSFSKAGPVEFPILSPDLPGLLGVLPYWSLAALKVSRLAKDYDLLVLHQPVLVNRSFPPQESKVVAVFHGTISGYYAEYRRRGLGNLDLYYSTYSALERSTLRNLASAQQSVVKLVGVSPPVSDELRKMSGLEEVFSIPNAVSEPRINCTRSQAREILGRRYDIAFSPKDVVLLSVGRLDVQKQPISVLELASALSKSLPNLRLAMVGEGSLSRKVAELSKLLPSTRYLGYVHDLDLLAYLYRAADVFISMSAYEGLPISALEASGYHLPCLLSDIAAHRWLIQSRITKGITVDSIKPKNDTEKVIKFLQSVGDNTESYTGTTNARSWRDVGESYLVTAGLAH